jgi:predicted ATPase
VTASAMAEPHVFVSYASVDRVAAQRVVDTLRQRDIRAWLDQADIPGATMYGAEIADGIRRCRALLLLCSRASLASRNVKQELMLAWKYQRPYLPLLLEPISVPPDLEYWLEGVQWIEVFNRLEDAWLPDVVRALERLRAPDGTRATSPAHLVSGRTVALPTPLTELLGRDAEVAQVAGLLAAHRLVSLTGPGGTGKTRLAIAAARAALDDFPDGAVFVDLAPVTDPDAVAGAIVTTLGLREVPGEPLLDTLIAGVSRKRLLLVLDNFEQVVAAATDVARLLATCPQVVALVTSRVRLRLHGERVYAVSPLAVPDVHGVLPGLAELAENPAVRLFVERTQDARPDFVLTQDHAEAIYAICQRLDGLPLAIELAAARTRVLSLPAMLERLSHRLTLLTAGERGAPARQRTLRGTIAWSHELLTDAEQVLFRRLAVFVDGFVLDAAEAVADAGDNPEFDALDGVASLVDKSLLQRLPHHEREPRFGMLQTIREYGLERLDASAEAAEIHRRHAAWCVQLAEWVARVDRQALLGNPDDVRLLETEYANLRAALTWLTEHGDAPGALRLSAALGGFWNLRGYLSDSRQWLEQALARDDGTQPEARVRALTWHAMQVGTRGDVARSTALLDDALMLAQATGDSVGIASIRLCQGFAALHGRGDVRQAVALGEESLAEFASAGVSWGIDVARGLLGQVAQQRGDLAQATARYEQIVAAFRQRGGDEYSMAHALHSLGSLAQVHGQAARAVSLYAEALTRFSDLGDLGKVAWCLEAVAAAGGQAQPEQAGRLFAAADALRLAIDAPLPQAERADYERALASVCAALGESAFDAAWQAGRALPVDAALAEAQAMAGAGDAR